MRSGRWRYARYQIGDFLLQKASLPAVLGLLIGGMAIWASGRQRVPVDWTTEDGARYAVQILKQVLDILYPLTAFLGINAISAGDRQHGHVRFYFSKPLSVSGYYLQAWFVYGLTLVAIGGLAAFLLQSATTSLPIVGSMQAAALTWVLVGGLGFLCSALTRMDGAVLILVWFASIVLRDLASVKPKSPLPHWLASVVKLLPPVDRLDAVRRQLYNGGGISWSPTWHVLAYGMGALVLGVLVLRRRSLVT